jgi:hypothetical protein
MSGYGGVGMRARHSQWLVMFSMESGKYYSAVYKAKAFGFNISAGADIAVRDLTVIVTGTGHGMCIRGFSNSIA